MTTEKLPIFYKKRPLFGFDIGNGSIKVVQLNNTGKKTYLEGYGTTRFDPIAMKDGEIVDFEIIASAANRLFKEGLTGNIYTRDISVSLPVTNSFSRVISLPNMADKDVLDAVKMEAEQYIPIPIDELYLDYTTLEKSSDTEQDYLVTAAPKRVVDSYISIFDVLGLRPVVMEPSILSVTRMVQNAEISNFPTLVIDCGSITSDLTVYDKKSTIVTGTVKFGGNTITKAIMNHMGLSEVQANTIKSRYGLEVSKKQKEIMEALDVPLRNLTTEIRKIIRYYEDRVKSEESKVEQVIILGGGANLPGFSTYLTSSLRIPTRLCSIWQHIELDGLQPPNQLDTSMYATAVGLAMINPAEVSK
jgi:type IV pilus assembly protein PilM